MQDINIYAMFTISPTIFDGGGGGGGCGINKLLFSGGAE
jgi:hypothetical protein